MAFPCTTWLSLAALLVSSTATPAASVTGQDMHVVGRALSFKDGPRKPAISVAVIYDSGNKASELEMEAAVAVARGGLKIGNTVLNVVAIEQSKLSSAVGYDAVFTTSSVDQGLLRGALKTTGVPCFTLESRQVAGGACTIVVRSQPSVSILINSQNAAAAGVSFATAFMMMVREI